MVFIVFFNAEDTNTPMKAIFKREFCELKKKTKKNVGNQD